jgi:tyrocidine synthetase III
MKILLTMNLPYTRIFGGANKSNKSLAEEFAKKGHEVWVVAPALATPSHITIDELVEELKQSSYQVALEDGCYVFQMENVKVLAVINTSQLRNKLVQKTLQFNPDWVFISAEDPSQTLLNAAFEAAPDKIIYLAHTPQMFPFGTESMYPGEKRTQVIGKSKLIVTISDFVAEYIRSNTGFEVLVNHPPHFGEGPYPNLADFENGFVLTMNPCEVKGISIFIGLAKAFPTITFAYVPGWGTTPTDKEKLNKLPNVVQLKNEPDLNDLLKKAKLMLMPSLWSEGFGMATVDAMLRGIPVLASNFGGLKEAKLGTDYLIDISPIQGFTGELDENSLPEAIIPEQNLELWKNALNELLFNKEQYLKASSDAYLKSHQFIQSLSIDKLEKWLLQNLPGSIAEKPKIDVKNLTPEQKKKLLLELQKKKLEKQELNTIKKVEETASYPLSYAQKRLWILDQINEGYYGYIIPSGLVLKGELNKTALQKAFELVIAKHESLRTYFVTENGEPRQRIVEKCVFELVEKDFSAAANPYETTQIYAKALAKERFDLKVAPLLRGALVKIAANEHVLLFAMHHIISDGWSMKVLSAEIYKAYLALSEFGIYNSEELAIQYKDYAAWQNYQIEGDKESKLKNYWFRKLGGELTVLNLPTDKPRPILKTYNGKIIQQKLNSEDVEKIVAVCNKLKISFFAYLTAAVKVLLHRYTDQSDLIVGTPTAGRNNAQLENQIGFYVNMLALRDEINSTDYLEAVLQKVNTTIIEALDHEAYPYDKIVEDLDQNRDLSRSPLFDVMVSLEDTTGNVPMQKASVAASKLTTETFDPQEDEIGSSHDIAFIFYRTDNELTVNVVYNTDLFEDWKGQQILSHTASVVEFLAKNTSLKVAEMDYLSANEKGFLLADENEANWPENKLIHQIFDEISFKYPDRVALSYDGKTLSYKELAEKSNQLAYLLKNKGVGRNTIVALLYERSNEMLVAIMAVLKAGGAYLPINPNYPQDRIDYTLSNSKASFVLTDESYSLHQFEGHIISIHSPEIALQPINNLSYENQTSDIAYIIYTSGSTGWPKGVMITHYNVVRLLFNDKFQFDFNESDVWTLFHSYCFDFSVWEMYGALLYGGKLIVVPKIIAQSPKEFWQLTQKESVTVLNQTPGAFYNLIEEAKNQPTDTTSIRYVIFGGEALNPKKLTFWNSKYPNSKLVNMYGITETTVHVTFKEITTKEINSGQSNIGKPIPTLQTYILDKNQNLLPIGVAGELCVGGLGLAIGYLNNPELTASRFINHPFKKGEKLYRSGDLAKLLPNAEMEYLGRIDFQVKIRGFRIELGEIESKLHACDEVEDCLVIVKKDEQDDNYLVAYYVSANEIEAKILREQMGKNLPDYMIPAFFVHYKSFPLNQNGKIDRKALIDPLKEGESIRKKAIIEPETATEKQLLVLWNEVLKKNETSTDDNFFEVGGHSLKANQLIGKIYQQFKVEIRLGDFFDSPTIKELSEIIDKKAGTSSAIVPVAKMDFYPMSYAQKRMWVLEKITQSGTAYTMPLSFRINGLLNVNKLEDALNEVVNRHEILRTNFKVINGNPVQLIHDYTEKIKILVVKIAKDELNAHLNENAAIIFQLDSLPLFRLKVLSVGNSEHYLLLNMHHIISDAQSLQVLFGELFTCYADSNKLSALPIQYKDFAVWQNNTIQHSEQNSTKNYWLEKLSGEIERIDLPTDFKRPENRSFKGANFSFELESELADSIQKLASSYQTSVFVINLALLNVFVSKLTNSEDVIIGSPVSGRTHPSLENQIGFYVNTLAFRDTISGNDSFSGIVKKVKQTVNDGLRNQNYPFDLLVEELNIPRDVSRNPLFDILISMDEGNEDLQHSLKASFSDLSVETIHSPLVSAKFDLTFGFHNKKTGIGLSINYNTDIFKEERIQYFANLFRALTYSLLTHSEKAISKLDLLSETEKNKLLVDLNANSIPFNPELDIIQQLKIAAETYFDKTALLDSVNKLTYQELWSKTDLIAAALAEKGIIEGDIIPIMLNRSVYTVLSIIGVLKTGAAYVFVDPSYPSDRIQNMLEDCSPKLVISEAEIVSQHTIQAEVLLLESLNFNSSVSFNEVKIHSAKLAYLIFTSGSTGRPKGVMISHRNLTAFLAWAMEEFKNTPAEIVYNATSYSFDLSVFEMFYTLTTGKTVRVLKNGLDIPNYLKTDKNVLLNTVPSVVKQLIALKTDFTNVKAINIAGEPIPQIVKKSLDFNKIEVRNLYGPSEDTTYSTCFKFESENFIQNIGKPIANTQAYILGKNGELLPYGVAGELCLAGDEIAMGYLNRVELTTEKFIDNPFGKGKLYKTGDLARWLVNGDLEYLGRIDKQVKIRGFRIELEEIERVLAQHSAIKDIAVADRWNKNLEEKYLAAYYVSKNGQSVNDLSAFLAEKVPSFMVPSHFVLLEKIPVSPNGKTDRSKLPDPLELIQQTKKEIKLPENEVQEKLLKIWKLILGTETISIDDNFFELGGQSLKAALLVNEIQSEFKLAVSIIEVFKNPTIEKLALFLQNSRHVEIDRIPKAAERQYYPLTFAQNRLYVVSQFDGIGTTYNMPGGIRIKGKLVVQQLENALQKLVERHEALRTAFTTVENVPVQFLVQTHIKLEVENCTDEAVHNRLNDFVKPFDLHQAPLFRVKLLQLSDSDFVLLYDIHHIIGDGVSLEIIIRDLFSFYRNTEPEPLVIQYKDVAVWQQEHQDERAEQFWLTTLDDFSQENILPYDFKRSNNYQFEGAHFGFDLDEKTVVELRKIAQKHNTSLFVLLFTLYGLFLAKISGKKKVIIGTPVAGRNKKELQHLVGMFVNNLAIPLEIDRNQTIAQYIERASELLMESLRYQDYPIEKLINHLQLPREMGRNPLFDTLFTLQTKAFAPQTANNELEISPLSADINTSKFDLTLSATELENKLYFQMEYAKSLFLPETIERLANTFKQVISQAIEESKSIREIEVLTDSDKKHFKQINNTLKKWHIKSLSEGFRQNVQKYPNSIAVKSDNQQLSFKELDELSNGVAAWLIHNAVKKDDVVAVLLPRNAHAIVAMLGIIKAGACYLPIDTTNPKERIDYYLGDSNAKFVVTDLENSIVKNAVSIEKLLSFNERFLLPEIDSDAAAYMIYTSGSTGLPKGVKNSHEGIVNSVLSQTSPYSIAENDHFSQFASFSFDASVFEIWASLLSGSCLHLISDEVRKDSGLLTAFFNSEKITTAFLPPVMLSILNPTELTALKVVYVGGEALKLEDAKKWASSVQLVNMYGPTEAAVLCTSSAITSKDEAITIGNPIANTEIYILNEYLEQVPMGAEGEICIAGIGVAKEYFNRAELTTEKFIPNPFSNYPLLYRTGDLGKFNKDNKLEYLGRIDNQVKVRGYRIELGEIENKLLQLEGIKQAVVTVFGENDKKIAAYIVAEKFDESKTKQILSKYLPDYMIPDVWVLMEEIPLTINGKVNFKLLPTPKTIQQKQLIAPTNTTQQLIFKVWENTLQHHNFGITDNFFEVGGNSILAMKVVSALSMDFEIRVNQLFENPTIEKLSKVVKYAPKQVETKLKQLQELFKKQSEQITGIEKEKIQYLKNELSTYRKTFTEPISIAHFYENVLVTGALGFLGMHLVNEMLTQTNSTVWVLVRSKNGISGTERLAKKAAFYFPDKDLLKDYQHRIRLVEGDLKEENLVNEFTEELKLVDAIIHTASNTSHFGNWEDFEQTNITGTQHVLNFAEKVNADVHYISTLSVAGGKTAADYLLFTENNIPENINNSNYYIQSKIEAEKLLKKQSQINVSIYRVGNLMPSFQGGIYQENAADNAFMNTMKFYFEQGRIPDFKPKIYDFTFIDETAKAIRLLMKQPFGIYHVTNKHKLNDVDFGKLIHTYWDDFEVIKVSDLIQEYLENLDKPQYAETLQAYIANSKVLESEGGLSKFYVSAEKTHNLLKKVGFEWSKVNPEYVGRMLENLEKTGFIQRAKELK